MAKARFFLAIADSALEVRVKAQLIPFGEVRSLRRVRRFANERLRPGETDTTIVSPEFLQRALRGEQPILKPFLDRTHVILALERNTFSDHAKLMEMANGWVFVDDQIDRLPEIVKLCVSGYCAAPFLIDFSKQFDDLTRSRIDQLTPEECAVLAELGNGQSDNAIISRLGIAKYDVRTLVRSVQTKLHVFNRIEIGALAIKYKRQISRARQRSISALTLVLILISWLFVSAAGVMVAIVQ